MSVKNAGSNVIQLAAAISQAIHNRSRARTAKRSVAGVVSRSSLLLAMVGIAGPRPGMAEGSVSEHEDQLTPVVVTATRIKEFGSDESSIGKLTQPMVDTPQSITTITGEDLRDLGVTNLNDALRTVPGISLGAGEYSYQGNNLILRGFTTRDDMFVDGQRDYGYYYRDPFDSQDIEVLKGPSSILFGRGSTGGVIDGVSKFPTLTPLLAGTGTVSSSDVRRATLDLGSPVPALGAGDAFRLNLMADHSAVADRATTQSDRWGVAPSLALGLGTPTRVLVSYYHQTENDVPDYGIPWFNNRPAPVDRSNFYGFSGDYLDTDVNLVSARFEHDFGPSMTLSSQARYSRDTRDFRLTEAIVPSGTPASTPIQNITVSRNEFQGYSTDTFYQDQTELTARFATGVLSLALVTGIEVGRESPEPTYITNAGVPGTNLADPTAQNYSDLQSYPRLKADTVANTVGIYGLDTVEFGRHWQLMGGIRWDRFDAHYDSTGYSPTGTVAANTHLDHLDQAFSYRGAIVYTPSRSGSIYVSTGTSFDPSAEGIESLISSGRTLAQANINLAPEKNRAYELGSKWSLPGGLLLTGALFRIEQYNTRVPDPTEPGFNTLGGDERVDGAEIAAVGRLTSAWSLRASYTYMDSKVIRSTPGGPLLGAPLTITPRNSSAVWIEYQLTTPLEIGAGALQMSSRLGQDTAASYEVAPGYVIFNAMAKYQFSTQTTLQLNVDNLTNRYYIDQLHPFHVIPGEGCMAQLALYVHY